MAGETAEVAAHGFDLVPVVALLGAAVLAVPIFKRAGLGPVLGYLAAGLAIGPYRIGLFDDAQAILHVGELGVVLFLFVIGLEMQPSRLWSMRREIFGLGLAQVGVCMLLLWTVGLSLGYPLAPSLIAGTGFVLTSTAIVMQMLADRGMLSLPPGRRIIAILLFEDLSIVPLLALVAFLAPGGAEANLGDRLVSIAIGLASIAALVAAGRWLLNPMFRILANAQARELLTAAALLVVLGAALAMQSGGLSMAMGAFLAGVMLSESTYRHQLEADVEPFRGILLGLFFMSVGMALDLRVVWDNIGLIVASVIPLILLKMLGIYAVARAGRASRAEAIERAVLMANGGEFAFVLYTSAVAVGLLTPEENGILTAVVIISMVATPVMVILHDRVRPAPAVSTDGVDAARDLTGDVLIIGFGRVGQVVSQPLLARGFRISIIDNDVEMIEAAGEFGFKVYYGDGARLDILHAAGAADASLVAVCVDKQETATRIVELLKAEFPLTRILVRSFDRQHAVELVQLGAEYQVRETFESAMLMGRKALTLLGIDPEEAVEIMDATRARDADRFQIDLVEGVRGGSATDLLIGNLPDRTT
jgi:CPA2 family monovalent cation:H+ antiporter-2/glutathione-regulated potassium-efflux system protein KefB